LLGAGVVHPAGAGLPSGAVHGEGDLRPGRSRPLPPVRRDGPRGRSVEDRAGPRLEGGDSLRAHPRRAPRLLAGGGAAPPPPPPPPPPGRGRRGPARAPPPARARG